MATKVSFGFGRLSDTELDNFAQGIIDAMTGNAACWTISLTPSHHEPNRELFVSSLCWVWRRDALMRRR